MYTRTFAVIELKLLLKFFNLFIFVVYYAGKKTHLIMIGAYYTQRNLLFWWLWKGCIILYTYMYYTQRKFIILMTEKGALYYTPMCIIHKLIR